jgi:hypothetical protein
MTWCDKLASTPFVGLKFDWHYASGDMLLERFAPILEKLNVGDQPAFGIDAKDNNTLIFTTNDGFRYSVTSNRLAVGFVPRVKLRHAAGGNPTLEMLSSLRPYSELLPVVCDKLVQAVALVPSANRRIVERIGIVSNTLADEGDFPPGVTRLLEYFGQPWAGALDAYNISVTARLKSDAVWSDRCTHNISKTEEPENVPTLNLDWQRTFETARHLNERALSEQIATASEAALLYFEELALGSMFDEDSAGDTDPA